MVSTSRDTTDLLHWSDSIKKFYHLDSMTSLRIEEVQSVLDLLDADRILVGTVLQDELLQIQERPLVRHFLTDLNDRLPSILGCELGAVRALAVQNDILNLEDLLQDRGSEDLRFATGRYISKGTDGM